MNSFKELTVWQNAYRLALEVYRITCAFPSSEQYGLASQMKRASVSIPSNIAEGYKRQSRKEYLQFLSIASGSAGELETQLLLSGDLGFLDIEDFQRVSKLSEEVSKGLGNLIKALKSPRSPNPKPQTPNPPK
ncbi:MAG: four helix bundle protein [Candidatus Methylomirabilota bacterium]|nr:MAG: four helix bundle protein [candidate division NC10 bacterium]